MKKTALYSLLVLGAASSYAQTCPEPMALKYLEGNEMRIAFRNGGDMFWDGNSAQFAVPYTYGQPQLNALFAGAVWMGGFNDSSNFCVAAQQYRSDGTYYWAGALDANTGDAFPDGCTNFDHIWQVKGWAIEDHIADFDDNGVIDNTVNAAILSWPGRGNPQFAAQMGFQLPNQDLAPFYDRNGNGLYEPLLGDYPTFEQGNASAVATDIMWSVFNDYAGTTPIIGAKQLQVEVQRTVFAFSCNNSPLLNKTFFVRHKVINRNSSYLRDFRFSLWTDPDLGCYTDDYIGCDTVTNTMYAYNADNDDADCNGVNGYGVNPPVQAITLLNRDFSNVMYYTNTSSPDPVSSFAFYRLMSNYWPDGMLLTSGGTGYDLASPGPQALFAFPDNPNNPAGWSMYAESLSGNDVRILGTVYKDTLYSGETFTVDAAYSFHRHPDSSFLQNVNLMEQQVLDIQQFYDAGFTGCTTPTYCSSNCIYPGDANRNGIANDFDILEIAQHYGLTAATRSAMGNNWLPYTPPTPVTNADADADGNGTINNDDFAANTLNFGYTNPYLDGIPEGFNTAGNDLFFTRIYNQLPFGVQTDTIVHLQGLLGVNVNVGSATQTLNDVLGFTFRVEYNEDVLELQPFSASFIGLGSSNLNVGWLDNDGAPVFARQIDEQGSTHFVAARLDGSNYSGGGSFGKLIFKVLPHAPVNDSIMTTQLCFSDFQAIKADGSNVAIGASCITVEYYDSNFVSANVVIPNKPIFSLYPNPVKNAVNINVSANITAKILLDMEGRIVATENDGTPQMSLQGLPSGIYFLRLCTDKGTWHTKLIKE